MDDTGMIAFACVVYAALVATIVVVAKLARSGRQVPPSL